jgi:hypothetical protein
MRRVFVRYLLLALMGVLLLGGTPETAEAAPDPVVASVMSASATAVPLAMTAILLGTGRGSEEGIRFDLAMVTLGLGSVLGPSAGQIYASGGTDAFVTFLLRAVTGAVMVAGVGYKLRGNERQDGMGMALAVAGAVPTGLLAIYDIYAASVSATEARYGAGYAQAPIPAELMEIAVCGPIPCRVGGVDNPMADVHERLALLAVPVPD